MKKVLFVISICFFSYANAQVGIGTDTPEVTSVLDLSSAGNNKGFLVPRITESQRDAITSPANGLLIFQTNNIEGFYYYSTATSSWSRMSLYSEINEYGDVKTGIQSTDHNGWVKLDGRLKSSLNSSQQARATLLGIGSNLPNANNAYLVQNGETLGGVTGSNSKSISQANLPNVNFTGNTNTTGNHVHNMTFQRNQGDHDISGKIGDNGHFGDVTYSGSMQGAGNHSHSVTVNSGGSGVALDITPKSLSINTFIYLGS